MLAVRDYEGAWALVTGASSGIGKQFARALAANGMNLVLAARREQLLTELASELEKEHACATMVLPVDLSAPDAAAEVHRQVKAAGLKIRLLVNNAASGRWGRFEDTPADVYESMIRLNMGSMVSLCHYFLDDLTATTPSAVINLCSPAALQPVPFMAAYAASKAFVLNFSQALHGELHERGVLVQTLVPGPTESEFDEKAGAYESGLTSRRASPDVAVQAALTHLDRHQPVVISAKGTGKQRLFAALAPRKMVIREVAKMFRPPKRRPDTT